MSESDQISPEDVVAISQVIEEDIREQEELEKKRRRELEEEEKRKKRQEEEEQERIKKQEERQRVTKKLDRSVFAPGLGDFRVFPDELLHHIFYFLSHRDMLNVCAISRAFYHLYLEWKIAEREREEKEKLMCRVRVVRNRLDLPEYVFKMEKSCKLSYLTNRVISMVSKEPTPVKQYYRLRRLVKRKNYTSRLGRLFFQEEFEKNLTETKVDRMEGVYLEQDSSSDFPGLNEKENEILITIRLWNREENRPMSVRDVAVSKWTTVSQLKEIVAPWVSLTPEQMVLVEEETPKVINLLTNLDQSLAKYGIITGDLIYVEPLSPQHYGETPTPDMQITWSFVKHFHDIVQLDVKELPHSTKSRLTSVNPNDGLRHLPSEPMQFKITSHKDHTFMKLKELISEHVKVPPDQFRVFVNKASFGQSVNYVLLKKQEEKLRELLLAFGGQAFCTNLGLAFLDEPEQLVRGDRLIEVQYMDGSELKSKIWKMHKTDTIEMLKDKMEQLTGTPREIQVICEWYNGHYYKFFLSTEETIETAKIRRNDVLRMEVVPSPELQPSMPVIGFQLVKFLGWKEVSLGRSKEMIISPPTLFCYNIAGKSLLDLRKAIAEHIGIPYPNINFGFASKYPPSTADTAKSLVKTHWKEPETLEMEEDSEEDRLADLAQQSNKYKITFEFRKEKQLPLSVAHLKQLDMIIYEDLRTDATQLISMEKK